MTQTASLDDVPPRPVREVALISDPNIHPALRLLWLEGAAVSDVTPVEVAAHNLALEVTDSGVTVLAGGRPFSPDAVILRSAALFMPLVSEAAKAWSRAGTLVVNDPAGVNVARDKLAAACALHEAGVPVVPTTGFFRAGQPGRFPGTIVVKPAGGSRGRGVQSFSDTAAAHSALGDAVAVQSENHLVAQPFWGQGHHDLRCFVVGNECVAAMRRHAPEGQFVTNVSAGGTAEPADTSSAASQLAVAATQALGLLYAGVDVIESDPPRILEVNALPSFVALAQTTGINPAEYIWRSVSDSLRVGQGRA